MRQKNDHHNQRNGLLLSEADISRKEGRMNKRDLSKNQSRGKYFPYVMAAHQERRIILHNNRALSLSLSLLILIFQSLFLINAMQCA